MVETGKLITFLLGIFFIFTLAGVSLGKIYANYNVQTNATYDLQQYANKTGTSSFVSGIIDKMKNNPLITIFTAPIDIVMYFLNLIGLAGSFFVSAANAMALPAYVADYLVLWVSITVVLGIFFLFFGRRP